MEKGDIVKITADGDYNGLKGKILCEMKTGWFQVVLEDSKDLLRILSAPASCLKKVGNYSQDNE